MDDKFEEVLPWTGERLVPTCRGQVLYEHLHRYAIAVSLAQGKRVLDIACGEGYGANLLATAASQVVGIDIAPDVIAHAKRAYKKPNLSFHEGSCLNIPLGDDSFDLVVSFETIEHLDDHETFLREIKRVLCDSGALIISSPDKREYTERIGNKNQFHKLELNREDFQDLLRRHFKNCRTGSQRLVVGSWIAPDDFSAADSIGTFSGDIRSTKYQPGVPEGVYSIALCSDAPLPHFELGVFENRRESENTWSLLERRVSTPILQLFCDSGEGFKDSASMVANLQPDVWQAIRFENIERLTAAGSSGSHHLRVDPVDRPALIAISKILITRYSDGGYIYSATSRAQLEALQCSAGLLNHSDEEGFVLIATDADPQLYLPPLDLTISEPCSFEIALQVIFNPTELVAIYHRVLKNDSLLREILIAGEAKLATMAEDLAALRGLSHESKRQIEQLRTENERQRKENLATREKLSDDLGKEIKELKCEKDLQRGELQTLSEKRDTLLELIGRLQKENKSEKTENASLTERLAGLEQNVKNFAKSFNLNSKSFEQADSLPSVLAHSLSRDIRRLSRKEVLRSVLNALGVKPANTVTPKSTSLELKQGLRDVQRVLKSKESSPAAAIAALTALVCLRRTAANHSRSHAADSRIRTAMPVLFDQSWYTKTYPAAEITPLPPLQYYLSFGAKEGHNPHPLFDARWYLSQRPAIENLKISPLEHYIEHGKGRSPHPLFDAAFYIAQYPDCLESELPPLALYLTTGWKLGYRPNRNFDPQFYLQTYSDVAEAKLEPLTHFVLWGQSAGRIPCREVNILFDQAWYAKTYLVATMTPMPPLPYYLTFGAKEGHNPHPLFDVSWYLSQQPAIENLKISPLEHYLEHGKSETRSPHPLFDAAFYIAQYPDALESELPPLAHYLTTGWKRGYRPNRNFDPQFYLRTYPDVAEGKLEPLTHFVLWGESAGRIPSQAIDILFDEAWYRQTYLGTTNNQLAPLQYYLTCGAKEGHNPHPLFDVSWYLSQQPPIENLAISPLEYYIEHGKREARSPHPLFDAAFYIAQYPDALESELPPLVHYLTTGWKLGYRPNRNFDPQFYLQTYSDVAEGKLEPLTHFVLWGQSADRISSLENVPFRLVEPDFQIPRAPLPSGSTTVPRVKAIAFYLPQFHSIPENDRWWGEGFTDWNNVRSGQPNYSTHYQPHVPTEFGYYDLRDPDVLKRQTELAKTYGLSGFCFYYYWFDGKVLLDRPLRAMLESSYPSFPFCLCWANENWTRRWDGREDEVLIAQNHSERDDLNFIRHIEPILLGDNYIRVDGKPLLLVYRPALFPNSGETTSRWREYYRRRGHGELHLVTVRSFHDQTAPETYGFDAAVQFPPHFPALPVQPWIPDKHQEFAGEVRDYLELRRVALNQFNTTTRPHRLYPGVSPSWDNTARRGRNAVIWANSSPEAYYEWLSAAADHAQRAQRPDERLVFINAWNEWGEGCHLEPDEKYEFAWLNATALALDSSRKLTAKGWASSLARPAPEPPAFEEVEIPAIPRQAKLTISVLFYHREDLIASFLESILPQINAAESAGAIGCSLFLAFNYRPSAVIMENVTQVIERILGERRDRVRILEHGYNLGFGAGHNFTFDKSECDIFLMLNSDVRLTISDWLVTLVDRFRDSDEAIVGLTQTASRLREDGCGIPISAPSQQFDFVDGSVLAVRSDLARRFGLFSPSFDYFYFEDVDFCLRYRQIGLKIGLLDIPYEHERSSSSRLLSRFTVEEVLNHNRARLFDRWGRYLKSRTLSNRIGIKFLGADRQLQCASLAAIFGLLADHRTAVVDLWGMHEQLVQLFQHPRIRLIPSWQTLFKEDYFRYYELAASRSTVPPVYELANHIGSEPNLQDVKRHLLSLANSESQALSPTSRAMIFLDRKTEFFDGKQPHVESFTAAAEILRSRDFEVRFFTTYGTFELESFMPETLHYRCAALLPGLELLKQVAATDLIISSDSWISELGQLLDKQTFVWLGATSTVAAVWNSDHTGSFADQSLSCLGCYHRFGKGRRNVCLRGDVACMRDCLTSDFIQSLQSFLDGKPREAAMGYSRTSPVWSRRTLASAELSLEQWPSTAANSVLVLTPINATLDKRVIERARELVDCALKGIPDSRVIYDELGVAPARGVSFPHRLAGMAPLRQAMIERHLGGERWVFWVDADVVEYPSELIHELISRAEGGIAAPLVLMEGDVHLPTSPDGFGPGRFYDIAGFVEDGRWARFTAPYFNQIGPVYQLHSVGCCYLVNADIYRHGARHELDPASTTFVAENRTWEKDAIKQNQRGPANSFSDHYTVCAFARRAGLPVQAFGDLIAYHQMV